MDSNGLYTQTARQSPQPRIDLIGVASSLGCPITGAERAPQALQNFELAETLQTLGISTHWHRVIQSHPAPSATDALQQLCQQLSVSVAEKLLNNEFFGVIGGDHACAIGTWNGVYHARRGKPFGLIWVDAHMDSHTPQSSHSGALHGMPLACLLGYGDARLTHLADPGPTLQPEHVCLIGVRSFEAEEKNLLRGLGVRIFDMQEIKQRGMAHVIQEALHIVTAQTDAFGLSIDLDAIDPKIAPAISVAEPDGLQLRELHALLAPLASQAGFLGVEIAEFNPDRDINDTTARLISSILAACVSPSTLAPSSLISGVEHE